MSNNSNVSEVKTARITGGILYQQSNKRSQIDIFCSLFFSVLIETLCRFKKNFGSQMNAIISVLK